MPSRVFASQKAERFALALSGAENLDWHGALRADSKRLETGGWLHGTLSFKVKIIIRITNRMYVVAVRIRPAESEEWNSVKGYRGRPRDGRA